MRILVFSDTHLTDRFNPRKYNFLKKIISSADQVIINGDFWENTEISFDDFVNSPWNKLFPLLKEKKAIYIYGNHDEKSSTDKRTSLFSIKQTYFYRLINDNQSFYIEHGQAHEPDMLKNSRIIPSNKFIQSTANKLVDLLEKIMIRTLGLHYVQRKIFGGLNNETKSKITEITSDGTIYICGHTHSQEIDYKNRYINTGIFRHGIAQYIYIENGKVELKEEWYA